MRGLPFAFDVTKVVFDEKYESPEYGTETLYFIAPREWLGDQFPEAVSAGISVEYPVSHPDANYATVMMSPTAIAGDGTTLEYSWYEIYLPTSEVEQLMALADKR